jgi:hypothetical protein
MPNDRVKALASTPQAKKPPVKSAWSKADGEREESIRMQLKDPEATAAEKAKLRAEAAALAEKKKSGNTVETGEWRKVMKSDRDISAEKASAVKNYRPVHNPKGKK